MVNVKSNRKRNYAVAMICEMLNITDAKLDAFIKTGKLPVEKPETITAKETIEKILSCKTIEELVVFELDDRKTVIAALGEKYNELSNN